MSNPANPTRQPSEKPPPSSTGGDKLTVPSNKAPSWFGSKTSCASSLENGWFDSQDKIIKESSTAEKIKGVDTGGGSTGAHGIPVEHPTSYTETLMHLFKGNLGSGLFAMGDAIKNAGIIFGPVVVVLLGVICTHCQHLLLSASRRITQKNGNSETADFARTVELCFENGPPMARKMSGFMRQTINFFLCLTQLGFCCVYFVFISSNLKQVCDEFGFELDVHYHMAIILLPIVLSCWVRNLKYLAPISTFANMLMAMGVVITFYYITQDLPSIEERHYIANVGQLPLFFGTAVFAFEGIGLVLPLKNEMKKPQQFQKPLGVLNVGMVFVTALYASLGFMAYLKYGEDIKGSVTLNIPQDTWLGQSVKLIISCAILLTYALQFYIAVDIMWPGVQKFCGAYKNPVYAEIAFRTLLVLVTFVLAEAIPYLNLFISLVGAVSSAALALLFPPVLEFITCKVTKWMVFKNVIILIIGVVGCVTGTYQSIVEIVHAFNNEAAGVDEDLPSAPIQILSTIVANLTTSE